MAAKKTEAHNFTTLVLNDEVPENLEGVQARIVTIAEEFKAHETALSTWYKETTAKLFKARDVLRLKEDPAGVLSEKDQEIAKLRTMLEEANKSGKSKTPSPDDRPIADADQEKLYEAAKKAGAGFHAQKDIFHKLSWDREHATPVVRRLIARGYLEKETGVKGPAPKIKVVDKAKEYVKDTEQMELAS